MEAKGVREDFLDEDPEISGQKVVLLSFISPENILEQKDKFFFQKFLVDYEVEHKVKSLEQFLGTTVLQINRALDKCADAADQKGDSEVCEAIRANRITTDTIMDQYQQFIHKNKKEITSTTIQEAYKDFLFRHQAKLEEEFHEKNNFQTTMRGLKVRGVYATPSEASVRAKKLQRTDPVHNILLGEVGKWLPWDPSPNTVQEQEYAEEKLNDLMKNYKKNEELVDNFYRENKLKRPSKQVFGSATGEAIDGAKLDDGVTDEAVGRAGEQPTNSIVGSATTISTEQKAMFDAVGDLALERKIEKATKKD